MLTPDAARQHPWRNVVTRALSGADDPEIDVVEVKPSKGDRFLLCSDGLWGPLTQRHLLHSLATKPLGEALGDLAELAEQRSGPQCDNVSVLAMSWDEDEVAPADEPHTIPSYELPTDVQDFTATDLDFLRMSDEDIEEAIADIKAALRKTPQ